MLGVDKLPAPQKQPKLIFVPAVWIGVIVGFSFMGRAASSVFIAKFPFKFEVSQTKPFKKNICGEVYLKFGLLAARIKFMVATTDLEQGRMGAGLQSLCGVHRKNTLVEEEGDMGRNCSSKES